jgi:hypothetical protein
MGYLFSKIVLMANLTFKIKKMKALKLGIFAMAFGLFAVSCSDNSTTDDSATTPETEVTAPETTAPEAPAATDTTMTPATTTDTTTAK